MGTLYLIATPIGNLQDVTLRALEVLKSVDVLFCEDTRVTRKLLDRHGIEARTESYREQVHAQQAARIVELLESGSDVGLVSDAGTPGVSDPGTMLVRDVVAELPDVRVVPIPGASAVTAALAVAGFASDAFTFFGFPPHKKGRAAFLQEVVDCPHTAVLYESPHRIAKTLAWLVESAPDRQMCLLRELTKMHESVYRGTATDIAAALGETPKGEIVLVVEGRRYHERKGR